MTEPLDLFARPPAQEESTTSRLAAGAIQPVAAAHARRVLACIAERPCTDLEGQERTGIAGDSWRPRRVDLERRGLIVADGTRPTRSGRQATVWRTVWPGEPPGARRSPGGVTGASTVVTTGQAGHGQGTPPRHHPTGRLWSAVVAAKPPWMLRSKHQQLLRRNIEEHPGDLRAGLRAALVELREFGGDR